MSDRNLVQRASGVAVEFFEWIRDSLASDRARKAILADLGLQAPVGPVPAIDIPDERLDSIDRYRQQQDVDFQAFLSAWGDIVAILEAIDALVSAGGANTREKIQEATFQLVALTGADFFRLRYPFIFFLSRLADVIVRRPEQFEEALSALETDEDADILAGLTLLPVAFLLAYADKLGPRVARLFGVDELPQRQQLYGWDEENNSPTPIADELSRRMLSFAILGKKTEPPESGGGTGTGRLGATFAWVPREHGGPGFFTVLHGSGEVTAEIADQWKLTVKFASSGAVDFLIRDGVTVNGPSDASASATIQTTRKIEQGPYIISVGSGTRLEIGTFTIAAQLGAAGASIKAVAKKSALVMSFSDGDAFTERTIPAREVRFDFDLGIGLSSDKGVFLEGGSGLQLTLAVNRSIGPVRLRQLHFALSGGPTGSAVRMEFLSTLDVRLGPITATLDRLGFLAAADPRERTPPTIGFRGPTGVGLIIDSEPVVGGGYLFADPEKGLYAGTVQLDIKGLTLQAVGLITTKMPDGSRGFSLLIILTVEDFTPINLGFGFRLTGVGGLVAYNRTADVEALRAGLKNRSLDAVLFPENPVADASRIVSTLQTVMPAREGQYMAGPVGQIEWGTPTVLTIEIGIVLEFPSPWRLLILGQIRALMPHEKKPLVRLQMDVLGVIDWDRDEISIDAVLYDSYILTHTLTGDMALRARWSGDAIFLLAVGGFHPSFSPPAGFPKLARVAMTINRGDTTRLRLEGYCALTSNTAQFGARVELLVRAGGFSVEGHLGFDALFQFSPFHFIVDIKAGITLKWHGRTLFGVDLELTLSGPSPWHAHGKATFKIWRFSKSVSFDRTCGADEPPPELPPADPLPELLEALGDPRNWSAQLPPATASLLTVSVRRTTTELLVHPAGELSVRQRVVPLGITIDRYGNTTPAGDRRFTIELVAAEGQGQPTVTPVLDFFAAAQFIEMSDASKLRRPSFEPMEAGVRIKAGISVGGDSNPALVGDAPMEFETVIVGVEEDVREVTPEEATEDDWTICALLDARRPGLGRAGRAKYSAPPHGLPVVKSRYVVASTRDLEPAVVPGLEGGAPSYTAALQALREQVEREPTLRGELQVITLRVPEGVRS